MRRKILLLAIGFLFLLFSFQKSVWSTVYGSISGKVIDEQTGKGVKGVKISLFQPGSDFTITAETNENGEFVFSEVIPGRCRIRFFPPYPYAWAPRDREYEPVFLEKGKNLYIIKKLKHEGIIEGKVYDVSTGIPLEGVEINVVGGGALEMPKTDNQGRFRKDRLYPGKYEVIAKMIGYGMKIIKNVEVKSKETTFVEIPFDSKDPTRVVGTVRCIQSGDPLRNALVDTERKDEYGWTHTYTDEEGKYMVVGLEPGIYEICVIGVKKTESKEEDVYFCKTVAVNKKSVTVVDLYVDCSLEFPYKKEGI